MTLHGTDWDVVIAGGGLAGGAAALSLARRGARVLVLEKGKAGRDKVCGEFLSPEALPILDGLGLSGALKNAGAVEVTRAAFVTARGARLEIPLPDTAAALSRRRLDALVIDAACGAGVVCRTGLAVDRFATDPAGGWTALGAGGAPLARGRVALWAAGKRPPAGVRLRRSALVGLKAHYAGGDADRQSVEMHVIESGYCGICPVEGGLFNVCMLVTASALRAARDPDRLFNEILEAHPVLASRLRGARRIQSEFISTAGLSYESGRAAGWEEPLAVGDAAGMIAPVTGDGMAMALKGAELAVPLVMARLEGSLTPAAYLNTYAQAWNREFAGRRRWGMVLHRILRDPRLAAAAVVLAARMPALTGSLYRRTRGKPR